MNIGDPIEVCRPFVTRAGQLAHQWIPATVATIDYCSIVVVFADFSRREYQPDPYIIRAVHRRRA